MVEDDGKTVGGSSCDSSFVDGVGVKLFPQHKSRKHVLKKLRKAEKHFKKATLKGARAHPLRAGGAQDAAAGWVALQDSVRGAASARSGSAGCAARAGEVSDAPDCVLTCNKSRRSGKLAKWLPCWFAAFSSASALSHVSCRSHRRLKVCSDAFFGWCSHWPAAAHLHLHFQVVRAINSTTLACRGDLSFDCKGSKEKACFENDFECTGFSWPAFKMCKGNFVNRKVVAIDTEVRTKAQILPFARPVPQCGGVRACACPTRWYCSKLHRGRF